MSPVLLVMVSDHSLFTAERFMGGLSASMYFFAVSRWMPTSLATPRIDSPPRFAFCTAFHLAVWSGVGFLCGMATALRTLIAPFSFDRVASIGGVDPGVECCQGSLPAPAQTVEVESRGRPV